MNQSHVPIFKKPYLVVLLIELALIVFVAGGSAYASIAGLTHPLAPFLGFVPIALFLALYLTIKKRWSAFSYGGAAKLSGRQWLGYAPLLLVLIVLLLANRGFRPESFSYFAWMLASQLLLVGFVEETLFRGIMLKALLPKGRLFAVAASSFFFGVTHALQALGGQSLEATILQIVYAFILGGVLAMLVSRNGAVWLAVLFHGLHNFLNFAGHEPGTRVYDYLVIAILAVHLVWLVVLERKQRAASSDLPPVGNEALV